MKQKHARGKFAGLPAPVIAGLMGVSYSTVKRLLYKLPQPIEDLSVIGKLIADHYKEVASREELRLERAIKKQQTVEEQLKIRWRLMLTRCYDSRYRWYSRHGGRGIKVCPEWRKDFSNFYSWALMSGFSSELVLDRINNDGDYEPDNCRWTTSVINTRNGKACKNVIIAGEEMSMSEAWKNCNPVVAYDTFRARIKRGWDPEEALWTSWK